MINSISSMGTSMQMMRSSGMQGPPPSKDQDVFQMADSNGDGLVSQTELEAIAEGIEEITGNTLNVDEALSSFDANQDGGLSGEEMLEMMTSQGFVPPSVGGGEGSGSDMKPPPPPPQDQDVFQVADTNGDGVVSQAELDALAEGIEEITGNTLNVDEALSSFDANQDGGLSGEEMLEMMTSQGFVPPTMMGGGEGSDSAMNPPPPSRVPALSAYEQNSSDDQIAQLIELLQSKESTEEYVSVDVTA